MEGRLFHYTTGNKINQIIKDGFIKLETSGGVDFKKQRPAVWCTFSPEWENTCNKGLITDGKHKALNMLDTAHYAEGIYRIEVDPVAAPHDWDKWLIKSNVSTKIANGLKRVAIERGSDISLWRASFKPINKEYWKSLEEYNISQKKWVRDEVLSWALF